MFEIYSFPQFGYGSEFAYAWTEEYVALEHRYTCFSYQKVVHWKLKELSSGATIRSWKNEGKGAELVVPIYTEPAGSLYSNNEPDILGDFYSENPLN